MRAIKQPLHKPPYVHNWVRYNFENEASMVKAMVAFENNRPQVTYVAGQKIISDRLLWQLDENTALKAAETKGHSKSRPYVREYVAAHIENEAETRLEGLPAYDELIQPFRISREVIVPVKPMVIVAREGQLVPVFMVGWASMPLDIFQRRLLMTVLEDAVFSLEDFRKSSGVFLSYPKVNTVSGRQIRKPELWQRGDYERLSADELREHLRVYLKALDGARAIINAQKVKSENTGDDRQKEPNPDSSLPLFDIP